MKDVRLGLVGLGRFGRLHLQVLRQTRHADIVALAYIDRDALRQTAIRYGIDESRCYEDHFRLAFRKQWKSKRSRKEAIDMY